MNSELIKVLKSLKEDAEFKPTAEFRTGLKQRLMAEVPVTGWFVTWPARLHAKIAARPEFRWRKWAIAVAGLIFMISGTTTAMAQKSLPVDRLYPVKIAGERAAMAVIPAGHQKSLAAAIVDRRLGEIEQLGAKHEDEAYAAAITSYREHLLRAENFRDTADEAWTGRIDRHWQILKELEEKMADKMEEKESPEMPDEMERMPTVVRPTEAGLPQPSIGGQINEVVEEKDDRKDSHDDNEPPILVLPEIKITIPAPQDLLSPILP